MSVQKTNDDNMRWIKEHCYGDCELQAVVIETIITWYADRAKVQAEHDAEVKSNSALGTLLENAV